MPYNKEKYVKQNFENGQVLNADDLIEMEDGIINAQEELKDIVSIADSEIDAICT